MRFVRCDIYPFTNVDFPSFRQLFPFFSSSVFPINSVIFYILTLDGINDPHTEYGNILYFSLYTIYLYIVCVSAVDSTQMQAHEMQFQLQLRANQLFSNKLEFALRIQRGLYCELWFVHVHVVNDSWVAFSTFYIMTNLINSIPYRCIACFLSFSLFPNQSQSPLFLSIPRFSFLFLASHLSLTRTLTLVKISKF